MLRHIGCGQIENVLVVKKSLDLATPLLSIVHTSVQKTVVSIDAGINIGLGKVVAP
jgi:hypothetical protein